MRRSKKKRKEDNSEKEKKKVITLNLSKINKIKERNDPYIQEEYIKTEKS